MQKRLLWIIGVATILMAVEVCGVLAHGVRFPGLAGTVLAATVSESVSSQIGQFAVNPQFDNAAPFINGLAAVRVGDEKTGKWGYIDKTGKMVINPQFDAALGFWKGGLAVVRMGNKGRIGNDWGVIDPSGKYVIPPRLSHIEPFMQAYVYDTSGSTLLAASRVNGTGYDSDGLLFNPQPARLRDSDLAVAAITDGDSSQHELYGFIAKDGHFVIKPQFAWAEPFIDGLALVQVGDQATGEIGFIDTSGKLVITPQFIVAQPFTDGLARVLSGHRIGGSCLLCRWGYIDKSGKYVVNPQFGWADSFMQHVARVCVGDPKTGKWGYIDHTGKYVVNPQFDEADEFTSDGLARVRIGGKWGYIRR